MKKWILIAIITTAFSSCGNVSQSQAVTDAKQTQAEIQSIKPGGIATSTNGYLMTATIDGKKWSARFMMPPAVTDRIIGDDNVTSISLPYDRRYMVPGKKIAFSHDRAVDLFTNDAVAIWGGYSGEMEITKVENNWAEGKFFFTASGSDTDKTLAVSDGYFKISLAK
jgi:hypothetical protein